MAEHELRTVLTGGRFFESPRWHGGRWWLSDFYDQRVLTVAPDGRVETVLEVPGQPSGLGWMPDDSLLVVSMRDQRVLRRHPDGTVTEHAQLSEHSEGHTNDMVVDASGRAWVGDFGFDLMSLGEPSPTSLKRVDPDGTVTVAAQGLLFPNGMVVTPDGRTLIAGESAGSRYSAWTIQPDGTLTDHRVWAQLGPTPELGSFAEMIAQLQVAPDGCTLDAENHLWAADALFGRCVRVAEGGEIVDEIRAPEGLGMFACMLGGDDGRDLLICAAPDFFEHNRAGRRDGVLLRTRVDVPHAGLP
jgi:sugar lactone lactonase YvrE